MHVHAHAHAHAHARTHAHAHTTAQTHTRASSGLYIRSSPCIAVHSGPCVPRLASPCTGPLLFTDPFTARASGGRGQEDGLQGRDRRRVPRLAQEPLHQRGIIYTVYIHLTIYVSMYLCI